MGKIRIKTLGSEEEKEDKKKAKARAEAKKIEAAKAAGQKNAGTISAANEAGAEKTPAESKTEGKTDSEEKQKPAKKKSQYSPPVRKQKRSAHYLSVVTLVDKNKKYKLHEALTLLPKLKGTKFDETVELHVNTTEKGISGNVKLPHGTGKKTRITIANQSVDAKHVEDLVKKIEAGQIDFDVLIATPDTMAKLAKVARILGPKGLMPNPKNGTVTPKPEIIAKQFEGGQINFKTESKFPLLHLAVGKLSFGEEKLTENIKAVITAVQTKNIKKAVIKSTMSPAISLDSSTL